MNQTNQINQTNLVNRTPVTSEAVNVPPAPGRDTADGSDWTAPNQMPAESTPKGYEDTLLIINQKMKDLQDQNTKALAWIEHMTERIQQQSERNENILLWDDKGWKLGHITLSMMRRLPVPIMRPPHVQTDNFPFTCANCGKLIGEASDICDDLYPLYPYDGKTVFCQKCFNEIIFPKRIERAQETYSLGKAGSQKRSAKMRKTEVKA